MTLRLPIERSNHRGQLLVPFARGVVVGFIVGCSVCFALIWWGTH